MINNENTLTDEGLTRRTSNTYAVTRATASTSAINLKNKFGSLIASFASMKSIGEDVLGGFILVESSGSGFSNGKLLIRFENHIFLKYVSSAVNLFKVENDVHYYYKNGAWKRTHASQTNEYEAFELAKSINEYYAYYSISMGLGQIMGFNCAVAGYDSGKAMYDAFATSETVQMNGFLNFIARYSNGNLLIACQNRDFEKMGALYNGDGSTYGPKLRAAAADYALA